MPMNITVILCTYNRCRSLAKTLETLAASEVPEEMDWEVLVVDNNSADQTREVVNDFGHRYAGRFRYVFERRPGKSHALNSGIRHSQGRVLAFTDDDVAVELNWLFNLTSGLLTGEWAGASGRILPMPGFIPPPWLAVEGRYNLIGAISAYQDWGNVPGRLTAPPFGANMAFRREMFTAYGHFRTDLGPFPGSKIGFEDTEFGLRLMSAGEQLAYVPSAVVYHEVNEKRTQKDALLEWWFDFGRGFIRSSRGDSSAAKLLKAIGRTGFTAPQWMLAGESKRRFYLKCQVWYYAGKIVELCNQMISLRYSQKLHPQAPDSDQ
jgi:glycosyltransferase involved in cell wall biosynthesis